MANVTKGIVVNEQIILSRIDENLPFLALEQILMAATAKGGNRQELHVKLRDHAQAASAKLKSGKSDAHIYLIDSIAADPAFKNISGSLGTLLDPRNPIHTGRAESLCSRFLAPTGPVMKYLEREPTQAVAEAANTKENEDIKV